MSTLLAPYADGILSEAEKDALRDSPCVLCLAVPPLPDGSRCHVHRIIRGRDGGKYVRDNVVALCPSCHRAIDRVAIIAACHRGAVNRAERRNRVGLTPAELAHARENAKKYLPKAWASISAAERIVNGRLGGYAAAPVNRARKQRGELTVGEIQHLRNRARKGNDALRERKRVHGLTDKELARNRAALLLVNGRLTPAERSARARAAGAKGLLARWGKQA